MPARAVLSMQWIPQPVVIAQAYFTIRDRANNLRIPMEEAVETLASEIAFNFFSQGRPDKWPALAAATVARRLRRTLRESPSRSGEGESLREDIALGTPEYKTKILSELAGGLKILIDSGNLEGAVSDPNAWNITAGPGHAEAELTDPTGYGTYHLFGRSSPTFMPVRDYTYISPEALDEIRGVFVDWVSTGSV